MDFVKRKSSQIILFLKNNAIRVGYYYEIYKKFSKHALKKERSWTLDTSSYLSREPTGFFRTLH